MELFFNLDEISFILRSDICKIKGWRYYIFYIFVSYKLNLPVFKCILTLPVTVGHHQVCDHILHVDRVNPSCAEERGLNRIWNCAFMVYTLDS